MQKEIIRFSKSSITYGIGHILTRFITFLLLPIYTNYLDPGQLGAANILFAWFGILTVVYLFGFDVSLIRFYVLAESKNEKRQIFSTGFLSIIIIGGIITSMTISYSDSIAYILNHRTDGYFTSKIITVFALTLLFDSLSNYSFLILRAKEKALRFLILRSISISLNFLLNIIFIIILKYGIYGIFLSNLYSGLLSIILILPVIKQNFIFSFSKDKFKELLKFGTPYIFSGIAIIMMDMIDRIILEYYRGYAEVGIYSAGYKLAMIMALIVAAFRFAWHPFFLSVSKQENAKSLFSRILTLYTLTTLFVLVLVSSLIPNIIKFRILGKYLIGKEYWGGIKIIPVIMISYIFYGVYVNFVIGIYLKKKSLYIPLVVGSSAIINIAFNIILIPNFGMWGAAFATLISYFFMMATMFLINKKLYYIKYEYLRLFKIVVISGVSLVIYYSTLTNINFINAIISISSFVILSFSFNVIKIRSFKELIHSLKKR